MKAILYWLKERLRDAWLWPLNLGRDFPARSGRLRQTLRLGLRGLPVGSQMMFRGGRLGHGPRNAARRAGIWLHLLLAQLFDLVGGPEICQFVMHLGLHTTPLTAAEQKIVRQIFGPNNLRYGDVRLAEGGILNLIFRLNGNLAFATWYTIHLPRGSTTEETAVSGRKNLPLLIHELTHVFQYHHVGSRYLGEAIYYLLTTRRDCYDYGGSQGLKRCSQQGKLLSHFNREQQAQIIQDHFTKIQANQDVSAYLPYVEQLRQRAL